MGKATFTESLIRRSFKLARKGLGRTSPNPVVGAILVKDGVTVGQGYHKKIGGPHAEINALKAAGENARGSDLYINLEPCSHHGLTPPCAEALIKAGIKRAFIAMEDPNPQVSGKGMKLLRESGIEVETGILEDEAKQLNEAFIKYILNGIPFVTMKAASTLDGRIATKNGESKWITGEASRKRVHIMRDRTDAILVGIKTIEVDDPSLTTRLPGKKGKDPVRIVLDADLRMSLNARVINSKSNAQLIVATADTAPSKKIKELEGMGVKVLTFEVEEGKIPLIPLLKKLGEMKISTLMIEGGSEVHASALKDRVVDKISLFYAPKIIGGRDSISSVGGEGINSLSEAIVLKKIKISRIGDDILVEGYPNYMKSR